MKYQELLEKTKDIDLEKMGIYLGENVSKTGSVSCWKENGEWIVRSITDRQEEDIFKGDEETIMFHMYEIIQGSLEMQTALERIDEHEKRIESIVMDSIHITRDNLQKCMRVVKEIKGRYYWNPVRGGLAIIINEDGEKLVANSSIPFEKHLEAFKSGKRN